MMIFLRHVLRKSLSETRITLLCNYYRFDIKGEKKGGFQNLTFYFKILIYELLMDHNSFAILF